MKNFKTTSTRRQWMTLTAAACAAFGVGAQAQSTWPTKPVTLIVPFPAGGGTDAFARPFSAQFAKQSGKTLVIDNRGGAGGNLGAGIAAKAAPDGYTLFMGGVHHSIAPSMYPKLDYDLERDFVPLALVALVPQVLVVNPKKSQVISNRSWQRFAKTLASLITVLRAVAPHTTWLVSCSSCKPTPSSLTSLTVVQVLHCKT